MSLEQLKQEMEAAVRWQMELMLKWSAYLMGDVGRYDKIKIVVTCRITAVQPTAVERSSLLAEYNAGLRSRESTMSLLGISDVDAEMARIEAEKQAQIQVAEDAATAAAAAAASTDVVYAPTDVAKVTANASSTDTVVKAAANPSTTKSNKFAGRR